MLTVAPSRGYARYVAAFALAWLVVWSVMSVTAWRRLHAAQHDYALARAFHAEAMAEDHGDKWRGAMADARQDLDAQRERLRLIVELALVTGVVGPVCLVALVRTRRGVNNKRPV